jgi:hypothetical protein
MMQNLSQPTFVFKYSINLLKNFTVTAESSPKWTLFEQAQSICISLIEVEQTGVTQTALGMGQQKGWRQFQDLI